MCLLNRNFDELEIGSETTDKMKTYFFSIAQQSYKENCKNVSPESVSKKILNFT